MPASFNPVYLVTPFTETNAQGVTQAVGYLLEMQYTGAPGPIPLDPTIPDLGGYTSYAAMIADLKLAASQNLAGYPYCYITGSNPGNFATDALCLAAAKGDCDKVVAKRGAVLSAKGVSTNPYATIGAAVYGPF